MKYTVGEINQTSLLRIIETIRQAEQSRNMEKVKENFAPIWSDFDSFPDFSEFELETQAALYRLGGFFLSYYGKSKNKISYQERGKDLLTNAIEIYKTLNDDYGVANAQNSLASCYFSEGAVMEAEIILEQTAEEYLKDKLHPVYLRNRTNLLQSKHVQKNYQEALKIIEEIRISVDFCNDAYTSALFHEKAGVIFRFLNQYQKAIYHYHRAIEYGEEINNTLFISSYKNNLANVYRLKGDFALAHLHEDEAIEIAHRDNHIGWLPNYLDTKASIYFDEANFKMALETIDQAISIFKNGEDAASLTEALWNKCRFLLYLNRKQEAIKLFVELAPVASEKMGEFAVDNLSREFAELIHVKMGGSLDEETYRFRRMEVITAIRNAKYELKTAAKSLKIDLAQLNRVIDTEFPELYEEINIERFSLVEKADDQIQSIRRNISELFLSSSDSNLSAQISTFYLASEITKDVFGFSQDVVIAIQPIQKIITDEYILICDKANGVYSFGKVQYDNIFDLYFLLENNEPMPFSRDEFDLIGKAVAYLPFSEIDNERLEFKPLNFEIVLSSKS